MELKAGQTADPVVLGDDKKGILGSESRIGIMEALTRPSYF